jgi:hypothetical protein
MELLEKTAGQDSQDRNFFFSQQKRLLKTQSVAFVFIRIVFTETIFLSFGASVSASVCCENFKSTNAIKELLRFLNAIKGQLFCKKLQKMFDLYPGPLRQLHRLDS